MNGICGDQVHIGHECHGAIYTCAICECLKVLQKNDPGVTALQHDIHQDQRDYGFVCSNKHEFYTNAINATSGCRICKLMKRLGEVTCLAKTYRDSRTPLRFRCHKMKHNPSCTCVDTKCSRRVLCNQEFYTTGAQLNALTTCKENHVWKRRQVQFDTLRIMETAFKKRFDDTVQGTHLTAYCADMQLAVLHDLDIDCRPVIAERIEAWCYQNNVKLIRLPYDVAKMGELSLQISEKLVALNYSDLKPYTLMHKIRGEMKAAARENALFKYSEDGYEP